MLWDNLLDYEVWVWVGCMLVGECFEWLFFLNSWVIENLLVDEYVWWLLIIMVVVDGFIDE